MTYKSYGSFTNKLQIMSAVLLLLHLIQFLDYCITIFHFLFVLFASYTFDNWQCFEINPIRSSTNVFFFLFKTDINE